MADNLMRKYNIEKKQINDIRSIKCGRRIQESDGVVGESIWEGLRRERNLSMLLFWEI